MTLILPRETRERKLLLYQERERRQEREFLEQNLREYVRESWRYIDSSAYEDSWALDALCDHLTAVTRGHIKRLLINFPPRCGKSNVTTICWPTWVWAQPESLRNYTSGPQTRFLCGSYGFSLSLKHGMLARRLLMSPFYQHYWGDRFDLMSDQNAKHQYDTTLGGSRAATSVGGTLIGIGGDILLVDDPHNTEDVESDPERETVLHWWRELSGTRLNNPRETAIVVVMQRLHQQDVTGHIMDSEEFKSGDWTHLMLPMRHDPLRHCKTVLTWSYDDKGDKIAPDITWEDPRDPQGVDLMWPSLYGEKQVRNMEANLGPYMASGRLQQSPEPATGGIIEKGWWQLWDEPMFPQATLTIASADTAYTEQEHNDPTGFTVWSLFEDLNDDRNLKVCLLDAWSKRLEMHAVNEWSEEDNRPGRRASTPEERLAKVNAWARAAKANYARMVSGAAHAQDGTSTKFIEGNRLPVSGLVEPTIDPQIEPWLSYVLKGENSIERWPTEPYEVWKLRTEHRWGLIEWMAHSCQRHRVEFLLIEGKASGLTAMQEMQRLHAGKGWSTLVQPVHTSKMARAYSVQNLFSSGLVYAPDTAWAHEVIRDCAVFPDGKHDDLVDSTTQALEYLRKNRIFLRPEERQSELDYLARQRPQQQQLKPLYPA